MNSLEKTHVGVQDHPLFKINLELPAISAFDLLKQVREHYSLKQVAIMLNVNPRIVNRWEQKHEEPPTTVLETLQGIICGCAEEVHSEQLSAQRKMIKIAELDKRLLSYYAEKLHVKNNLNRKLVSFQANKNKASYRWYKYKEGFSADLVEHFFHKYKITQGKILDPFAGSGTTLFTAMNLGLGADVIELLPIGHEIIESRLLFESPFKNTILNILRDWYENKPWLNSTPSLPLQEIRITRGAYPEETAYKIRQYLTAAEFEIPEIKGILKFVLLCVLEQISYTRKDGQYLRWDYRSGRKQGKSIFNKGDILAFDEAITQKITEIIQDVKYYEPIVLFPGDKKQKKHCNLLKGSCLDLMPQLPEQEYMAIFTSPPYCNRYDYTRTYALELALLGSDEANLVDLRQRMLSCTVENRAKDLLKLNPNWENAIVATDTQELLQEILKFLDFEGEQNKLNNKGIPRMVRGYFYEMACIISECNRVLKPGAEMFMVNDNVRYAGVSISVDLILSNIAEKLGFDIQNIFVLPNGKGNSSQQMGEHGRESLRKCIYVWRKK